ncbi:MAG: diacylglycerol kinase family protein [Candidatus Binatia bacterium]
MRVVVIINPISGAYGRPAVAQQRALLATNFLSAAGVAHEVHITECPGHAYKLARGAVQRGVSVVFAWGGDGTMNEVGRALAFSNTALALIPAGSGNGLARELCVPLDPTQALKKALHAADHCIDVGQIDEYLFFNAAGIGFDAHVSMLFNNRPQQRRGLLPYVTIALREIFSYRPHTYDIRTNSETLRSRALLIALANSRQYGNGAVVAPQARLDDGLLDLVVIQARSTLATLKYARHLFTGTLATVNGVLMRKVTHATITAQQPLSFHVDGEPLRNSRATLTVQLHPAALRVRR